MPSIGGGQYGGLLYDPAGANPRPTACTLIKRKDVDTYIDVPNSVISGNEPSSEML